MNQNIRSRSILIAPSLLAADFSHLANQIRMAEEGGADWIHIDVMDGHFVPNITMGPFIVKAIRKCTTLPLDVHLMIEHPDRFLEKFRDAGADIITVHQEASYHLHRTLHHIRELGAKSGVSLNPATPCHTLSEVLHDVDLVLLMTVNPGFGGQSFIPRSIEKIRDLCSLRTEADASFDIEVDGGIDASTATLVTAAGANVLVAGTYIFSHSDISVAIKSLRSY
ncbi:MAG: ribulose-phosphate 3-epimerase [bacterium]